VAPEYGGEEFAVFLAMDKPEQHIEHNNSYRESNS